MIKSSQRKAGGGGAVFLQHLKKKGWEIAKASEIHYHIPGRNLTEENFGSTANAAEGGF